MIDWRDFTSDTENKMLRLLFISILFRVLSVKFHLDLLGPFSPIKDILKKGPCATVDRYLEPLT